MPTLRFLVVDDDSHPKLRAGDIVTVRRSDPEYPVTVHRVLTPNYGVLLGLLEARAIEPLNRSPDEALSSLRSTDASRRPPSAGPRVLPLRPAPERPA
jgi:hypothetical protein